MNTLVLEETGEGDTLIDVYQKLANDRILFINEELSDTLATDIVATLLLKDAEDPGKKITLFINCFGGDIRNAFMIYDVMKMIQSPIETICIGAAFDEAVILLAGGKKGERRATPHAIIAVRQLTHDYHAYGNLSDATKLLKLSKSDNDRLMQILSEATDKPLKQVRDDFERRTFMTARQAAKYGLIDTVGVHNKE